MAEKVSERHQLEKAEPQLKQKRGAMSIFGVAVMGLQGHTDVPGAVKGPCLVTRLTLSLSILWLGWDGDERCRRQASEGHP